MNRISPSNRALRKSAIIRRYVYVSGRNVSVSIEDPFWNALEEIADIRDIRRAELISTVKSKRQCGTLSSARRLFVLDHYRVIASVGPVAGRSARRAARTQVEHANARRPDVF